MKKLSTCIMRQVAALFLTIISIAKVSVVGAEMALDNVTRNVNGDIFTLSGSDCGLTRCMEYSHGTALSAMDYNGCSCQCRKDVPAFREDQRTCVNLIDEYLMASFGKGAKKPSIPYVFLPLKGQIIYPAKEIIFTDVEGATCAVTSAQYLSPSGWVTLRDAADNDVPFSVYRDEGSTFLQWRGSQALHSRLEGRLVAVHVLCSAQSTPQHQLLTSCAVFRVAGVTNNALLDVRSIPFHAGETVNGDGNTNQGLSLIESVAIGVCVLMLIFVYAAGIIFYVHYKQRLKRKDKDPELNLTNTLSTDNGSTLGSRMDMESLHLKTNPLLKMENLDNDFLIDGALSDVSERTEETLDGKQFYGKLTKQNSNLVSAMVHSRQRKPPRPKHRVQARSSSTPDRILERIRRSVSPDGLEVAPHSDLSIVDCSVESNAIAHKPTASLNGEPALRRKLFFNPIFFETELLRNPPAAAIDFLIKIREVMAIAKDKMTSKRFIPNLSDIPEEESYHTIDLGWDIPCARQGRRFSAISLKRENSRRALHCGGCPGCDSDFLLHKNTNLARSNSCKVCVSDDYKQIIVRKWLDEVPSLQPERIYKSVAKVSGTPRHNSSKTVTEIKLNSVKRNIEQNFSPARKDIAPQTPNNISTEKAIINVDSYIEKNELDVTTEKKNTKRRIKRKLPPPPPPPCDVRPHEENLEEEEPIPMDVKVKMQAVIQELNNCRRTELGLEKKPPKLVIPVSTADPETEHYGIVTFNARTNDLITQDKQIYFDSLERNVSKRSRSTSEKSGIIPATQQEVLTNSENCNRPFHLRTKEAGDGCSREYFETESGHRSLPLSEFFIKSTEPYYHNVPKPGPLTIEVRGTPVEDNQKVKEDFDPDTLDRKPKIEAKKRVDKILLKSGGSFKHKTAATEDIHPNETNIEVFTRKIGSLRQIYEAKNRINDGDIKGSHSERRGSLPQGSYDSSTYVKHSKAPDLIQQIELQDTKPPPLPPKQLRVLDTPHDSPMSERRRLSEERDRFPPKVENVNTRRSVPRSNRTKTRRTDLTRLSKTEDAGYLSTDSNESKRRASYYLHLKPKNALSETVPKSVVQNVTQVESDTDEMESLCDGHSESGAESVETDSVFFGNVDDSTQVFRQLTLSNAKNENHIHGQEQIDSGFAGETNIVLSGDSDSEHKSVISIMDGKVSASSRDICDQYLVSSVENI